MQCIDESLGLDHDGEYDKCTSSDNFIMANSSKRETHRNYHLFSKCSITALGKKISSLEKDKETPGSCLRNGENINIACIGKDFKGTLKYTDLWGQNIFLNCKQLVNFNSSFCYDDAAQEYCCASCRKVKLIEGKDYCTRDNDKVSLKFLPRSYTCKELVKFSRRHCDDEVIKRQCCKSCGFKLRPLKVII